MAAFYKFLLSWSEVWPLAIALTIFILFKQRENINLLIWMIATSLVLHFIATFVSMFTYMLPDHLSNNNIIYNLIAFEKPLLFCSYLLTLESLKKYTYLKIVLIIFILFTIFNFVVIENIFVYSSLMVLAESVIMLIFILTFFLDAMIDDDIPVPLSHPAYYFCIATGLFESINFLIYLFIFPVYNSDYEFAIFIMKISSIAFIVYGLIFAIGIFLNRSKPRFFNTSRLYA